MSPINNIASVPTLTIPQHYTELILEELFASLFHAFIAAPATDEALATTQTMYLFLIIQITRG